MSYVYENLPHELDLAYSVDHNKRVKIIVAVSIRWLGAYIIGGYTAVLWTDSIQGIILFVGFIALLLILLSGSGLYLWFKYAMNTHKSI